MSDLMELLDMMRPGNCAMAAMGVFIGALIALGGLHGMFTAGFVMAIIAVFAITGAGNAVNDFFDTDADKMNRPQRPIPSGAVSKRTALMFTLLLFALGNFCAMTISWFCFALALANSGLLVLYSWSLQHKIFVGNITVGYLSGSVFLFGAAVFFNDKLWVALVLASLAMLVSISREVVKDMEDIEGDRKSFMKRIASRKAKKRGERFSLTEEGANLKYGEKRMIVIAIFCLVMAMALSAMPHYYAFMGPSYVLVVLAADAVFVWCIYSLLREERKKKGYARISKRLKIGMFIAMLAFMAGVMI
jgi:geranylgeranylglycerol-phosphate geranylgeranyltransferase